MSDTSIDQFVLKLAAEAGVLTRWVDAWDNEQSVSQDDLIAVLTALTGRALNSRSEVADAIDDLVHTRPPVEPVIVAWDGAFPDTAASIDIRDATLILEDGTQAPVEIVDRTVGVAERLPIGYHQLVINGGAVTSHVFSAPRKAAEPPTRALGVIAPTYSLRSGSHDAGIGTLSELSQLAALCDEARIDVVGTLPLLSAFTDEPSPYAPASRRAWNEIFVDFAQIPGWQARELATGQYTGLVDYDSVGGHVRSTLADYSLHVSATPRLRGDVDAFLDADPEMRGYARFMATVDAHGRNWRAWAGSPTPEPHRVAYHETVQWLMHTQLERLTSEMKGRGQYLYLDLPIGCHPDGFDIWSDPDLFAPASLGAPPDTLFVNGQDWGLPATVPSRARLDGHSNFRKAIAKQLSVAGLVRIDHVMGILRTWWVPHGSDAKRGAYVMHAADEMFAIICIESARANVGVVGENLGTVPQAIREGLVDHNLLGMAGSHDTGSEPSENDLVAVSTHDTPSFAAWWAGDDIEDLVELGVFDPHRASQERKQRAEAIVRLQDRFGTDDLETTRDAVMQWMAGSDAAVALVNLDDLLLEERRQNVPGTDTERPNWRLRHRPTIDQLRSDEGFMRSLETLAAIRSSD